MARATLEQRREWGYNRTFNIDGTQGGNDLGMQGLTWRKQQDILGAKQEGAAKICEKETLMARMQGQVQRKNPNILAEKQTLILKPQTVMRAKKGGIVKGVGTELFSHKGWNVQQVLTRIPNCTQNSFLALCIPISNQIYNKKYQIICYIIKVHAYQYPILSTLVSFHQL